MCTVSWPIIMDFDPFNRAAVVSSSKLSSNNNNNIDSEADELIVDDNNIAVDFIGSNRKNIISFKPDTTTGPGNRC